MYFLGRRSIRKTIMSVLLLTSSIALTFSVAGFAIIDWMSLRNTMYNQLRAQAGIIGSNSVAAITFGDAAAAASTLSSLESEANIIAAVIFTNDGQPFAQYQRHDRPIPRVLPYEKYGDIGGDFFVSVPITFDNKPLGTILLVSELSYWNYRQFMLGVTVLGMFLLSLMVVYFLSRRLQRVVTEPILKLAHTAQRITESEDYSLRAEKLSKDEIGGLVDDFNEMLMQIQLRDRKLQHSREELEVKVDERTWELTELTRQLEHQAYHDTLTGLANRITFDDHLRLAIHQSERYGGSLAVLFLDLDRFKVINDTLGHVIGDKLLIQVAHRFSECVRSSDTLARLGGDEFAILLQHQKNTNDTADIAQKLIQKINQPFSIDGYSLHISTSIGISLYPDDGDSAETIIKNADTAMYRSKDQGKNQFTFFAAEMNNRAVRRLELENKLRLAIDEKRFCVYYQPRRDTNSLAIIGVEALIRWFDRDEGEISPSEFIPLAEECGLAARIDEWVLETACRDMLSWFDGNPPPISLSVNFSATHFIRKDLPQVISAILLRTGFPGSQLELEITENLFGPDTTDVLPMFQALSKLGLEFSIDDFGKAYSSLSRLKQLPLQTLKIDRFFIQDVGIDPDDEILVRTIISMAHNLGLKVVAEGIETMAHYRFVKAHGCDAIQGFLYGKPAPSATMSTLLNDNVNVEMEQDQ